LSDDPHDTRRASLDSWEAASAGWRRRRDEVRAFGMPVAERMIGALGIEPGNRVLELAAGLGDLSFMACDRAGPDGCVIVSDQAEGMLEGARDRARELGVGNAEFRVVQAESIDLDAASVDVVMCRWAYMLMADPLAALRETRRVLRPGGRLALAVWGEPQRNPWVTLPMRVLVEQGLAEPPSPSGPGIFALSDQARLRATLEDAGFGEITIESVDVCRRNAGAEDFWQTTIDLSAGIRAALAGRDEDEIGELRRRVEERLVPYTDADGAIALPGRSLVAVASA
jgi:SAM-dependent methyltransferase